MTSSSTLDRLRYLRSQISSGYIATRLYSHTTTAPGAQQLTLTSSSTLDRSCYLRSQISSGYIATRLYRQTATAQVNSCKSDDEGQPSRLTSYARNRPCSLRNQFNSCKSDDGGQPFRLTSSARNRSCSLRNWVNSCKSDDGGQPSTLTSSIILHRPCSLGISSTQANQLTKPNSSHWRAQSFYTSHAAWESIQLRQISRRSPTAHIEELNHSTQAM